MRNIPILLLNSHKMSSNFEPQNLYLLCKIYQLEKPFSDWLKCIWCGKWPYPSLLHHNATTILSMYAK